MDANDLAETDAGDTAETDETSRDVLEAPNILWRDDIQDGSGMWGFDGIAIEHPIGNVVEGADSNGANLSRVADPAAGGGFALRHFATFDDDGSRSQAGIWSFRNSTFADVATSVGGVYVAQEWYFPEALSAGGDDFPWLNLWDWHSTGPGGADRWDTSPGLMLAEDGSMRVKWEWGPTWDINPVSGDSSVAMPVAEWFDIEMYYLWTADGATLRLWINGELALSVSGAQTRLPSHTNVEMYTKFYGSSNGRTAWSPTPSIRYTRNVRVSDERIWRD